MPKKPTKKPVKRKPKNEGTISFGLKAERGLGYAGAPCEGYYWLQEYTSKDSTERINSPSMFEVLQRALGKLPPHGSTFEVTVTVAVKERAVASKKKCHNPWPGHSCNWGKK
jgi:hypothetical protein